MTSSDDEVARLEAQLQKVKAEKAARKATEKAAAEAKRIAEEKVAAEAKRVEERRRAELEEQRRAVAAAKVWEEAEGCRITEGLTVVKRKAVLAMAEIVAEEAETEQAVGMPVKQTG